ncbi:HNH endonuclease [Brevibacillus porteri]|uniref:HNH endonuclease n=1 Tax=Brevibacillus porteri TaxID=2126350 RepID=A0ABX5FKQ4_9BACL|nr:HNH endonuclease signature motif containing protein [Brevibacillus porteri]MED1800820.1 HNH endonuclease signature motif containing protein [Brevibacillus porteri]MED2132580.1 HNH endonuclease signature motif containing protein [Brevibacillus porteri]MED2747674.1 HNH endonuclease signature motif containing protein [Brevibacillus porteri]MED2818240.1 HNH endonuclease signature motif containing protein [Brevibacillus porteri]MED2894695.1 HNH endonuclease signature motif containing protein [Br
MKIFKRVFVPFVVFSLLVAPMSVLTPASAESIQEIAETEVVVDFENLPIQLAEGVTLEELAEAINEPRILESKNVTIIENSSADEVIGKRQMEYSPNAAPVEKEDDTKFDFGAFSYNSADKADKVAESDTDEVEPSSSRPSIDGVFFDHQMTSDWARGDVYSTVKVTAVVGRVASVDATHTIIRSATEDGKYRVERNENLYLNPPYANLSTHRVRANAETYWWSGKLEGTVRYRGGGSSPIAHLKEVEKILTNNKGEIYPDYVDPQSNIKLIKPDADMVPQKRERDSGYRKDFERRYVGYFGQPQYFAWDDVEIHHMIPLEYYGKNHFDNLIPLLKKDRKNDYILPHREVTEWWESYRKN